MPRTGVVVLASTGIALFVGLMGCSGGNSPTTPSSAPTTSSSAAPTNSAALAPGGFTPPTETKTAEGSATLTVDGKARDVKGEVSCSTTVGSINILIAQPTAAISIALSEDASSVQSVGIGSVDDVSLSFQEHAPGVEARATRDGNNYTVTGTAIGYDKDNPDKQITKPFEISVSCP